MKANGYHNDSECQQSIADATVGESGRERQPCFLYKKGVRATPDQAANRKENFCPGSPENKLAQGTRLNAVVGAMFFRG